MQSDGRADDPDLGSEKKLGEKKSWPIFEKYSKKIFKKYSKNIRKIFNKIFEKSSTNKARPALHTSPQGVPLLLHAWSVTTSTVGPCGWHASAILENIRKIFEKYSINKPSPALHASRLGTQLLLRAWRVTTPTVVPCALSASAKFEKYSRNIQKIFKKYSKKSVKRKLLSCTGAVRRAVHSLVPLKLTLRTTRAG